MRNDREDDTTRIDDLLSELNVIATKCDHYDYGLPLFNDEYLTQMRDAVREAFKREREVAAEALT